MIEIKGYNGRYLISKDATIWDCKNDEEVLPVENKNGVNFVPLLDLNGNTKRLKVSKLFREYYNDDRLEIEIELKVLKMFKGGNRNLRNIANNLNISIKQVNNIVNGRI